MKKLIYILVINIFYSLQIFAVTKTSVANGNWSSASTWSPNGVPAATDDVIINTDVILDVDVTMNAGGNITINSGKSLVGILNSIFFVPNTSTAGTFFINNGTVSIARFVQSTGGCVLFDFTNNGEITINDTDAYPTTSSSDVALFFRGGHIINNGNIFIPNGEIDFQNNSSGANCNMYVGTETGTFFENFGLIVTQAFLQHNYSEAINHATGQIIVQSTASNIIQFGGYFFNNYGYIQTCGGIVIHAKSGANSAGPYGGSALVIYDNSHIYAPGGGLNTNSNTYIVGSGTPNNGCIYIGGSVNNSGAISGTFTLHTPSASNGTVGPNVTWTNGDCGWASLGLLCNEIPSLATCAIDLTAQSGICNPTNNQYSLTGTLTFSNAPTSGTLTVSVSGGGTQSFNAPFTSPQNYSISGLTSDGVSHTVTAVFSADATCTDSKQYLAPSSCAGCDCYNHYKATQTAQNNSVKAQFFNSIHESPDVVIDFDVYNNGDNLENIPLGTTGNSVTWTNLQGGTITASNDIASSPPMGTLSSIVSATANTNQGDTSKLTFQVPVDYIGFYILDLDDESKMSEIEVTFTDNKKCTFKIDHNIDNCQCEEFLGIVAPQGLQISSLIIKPNTGSRYGLDSICYGQNVGYTFAITPATCTGVTENNNGKISLTKVSIADKYGVSSGSSYTGPTYSGAISIGVLPVDITTNIPNAGGSYTIRFFNGLDICFKDTTVIIAPVTCSATTCSSTVTATPGTCNPATNQYTVTGNITFTNPPTTGTLTVSVSGGGTQLFNAPFTSPQAYTILGLTADGSARSVTAVFSADMTCTSTINYIAPASCLLCVTPTAVCTPVANTNCVNPNGSASVSTNATSATYLWNTGATTSSINGLTAGNYTVTVTNTANSCTNTCIATVTNNTTNPSVTCSKTDNTNCAAPNGTASTTVSGVTYLWSNGATTSSISNLSAGTYTVTVTSTTTGCTNTCQAVVANATVNPTCNITANSQPSCANLTGGSITVTPSPSGTYSYAWSDSGPTTATRTGLTGGTYTVTVTNTATSCTGVCNITLTTPTNCCNINAVTIQNVICNDNNTPGKITDNRLVINALVTNTNTSLTSYNATVNGGTTITPSTNIPYGSVQFTLGPGTAGGGATFTITVTDSATPGCTQTFTVTDPKNCPPATQCPTPQCGTATIQVNGN